ncbi:MAG: ADP-glyceromanno-heptose 6-epimerase [Synergistaceae bacterium]|jgi:ADP-L-glycero-D-manno-heptose 6-epimerase|nr:ADP-glyceromanno-heptose 6-epimerase [Synergistaceae bacterium]
MLIVTGGAGFIGSNIVAGLEKRGHKDIVVVDRLGAGDKWKNIAKRELAAVARPEDIMSFLHLHEKEISCIAHMGAVSTTTEKDCDWIIKTNFSLSWSLWEYCRDHGKRFIYASSAATYGSGERGFDDRDDLPYLNALRPMNPYGWSKALFDRKVARELAEKRSTPTQYAGLKFFNVYGPNEYHKEGQKSVVAHIFPQVKEGNEVQLFKSYNPAYKDGEQLRDFVWVGDCVSVVLWLLDNPNVSGLFNVGSGQARSFHDLAKAVFTCLGLEPKIKYKDMPAELIDKYQYYTKAEMRKLSASGYPYKMTTLEEGVSKYVKEYLDKDDMYV